MPNRQSLILAGQQSYVKPPRGADVDPEHPLARKLLHAYLFNEGAGQPLNAVNPAQKITLGAGVSWIVTKNGPALHFNNSTTGRAVMAKGFTPSATAFSVELMLRPTANLGANTFAYLLGSQSAGGNGVMWVNAAGLNGWDFDTTTSDISSGAQPTLNLWYHLHYVYLSSSSATIYENAISVASGALGGVFTTPLGWLGADGTNASNNAPVDIAWLRIWDRALSATEVQALYNSPWDMMIAPNERLWTMAMMGGSSAGGGSTPISVSDSATGDDSILDITAQIPVSDSATGTDTPSISAQIPVSDTGAGTDSVAISASFSLSDSAAAGAEAITIGIPVVDSATTTETIAINASLSLTDNASGTQTPTVTANVPVSDTGSGTDTPTINVSIPLNDAASASDAINVATLITVSDTGSGTDVPSITANISITDAASGTQTQSISVSFNVTDSGTASDSVSVNTGGNQSVGISDSATGTDTPTISAQIPQTDTGAGSDTPSITANVSGTDTGAGGDSSLVTNQVAASDSATGTQTVALGAILVSILDNATGVETRFISVTVPIADTGVGGTSLFVNGSTIFVNVADSAAGAESILRLAMSGRAVPIAMMSGPGGGRVIMRGVGVKRELFSGPSIGSHRVVMRGD